MPTVDPGQLLQQQVKATGAAFGKVAESRQPAPPAPEPQAPASVPLGPAQPVQEGK